MLTALDHVPGHGCQLVVDCEHTQQTMTAMRPTVRQQICRSCNNMLIRLAFIKKKNVSLRPINQYSYIRAKQKKERNKQIKNGEEEPPNITGAQFEKLKPNFLRTSRSSSFSQMILWTIRFSQRNGQTVSHFKCRTGKKRERIWILTSCQLHRVMSGWKRDKKQIRDRSTDSVSMKGRQKANQRQINWQCQHERETKSKSETDQLTVSAWKGDKKQVRDRSVHSVSMKERQKASQRQINSQCQHERETESKSEADQFSVSMKERQKASQRQIDGQTQEWWTERQEHREREGRKKTEKKQLKNKPFFSNIAKFYVLSSGLQCWHSVGHSPPLKIIQLWRIHLASARNASVHPYSFFLMFCEGFNTGQQNQYMQTSNITLSLYDRHQTITLSQVQHWNNTKGSKECLFLLDSTK